MRGWVNVPFWAVFGPTLLVLLGGMVVYRAMSAPRVPAADIESSGYINTFAVMSGTEHKPTSVPFEGANLGAVMGGVKLDLIGAEMKGDTAVIDVFAVMGGIEIFAPREWEVAQQSGRSHGRQRRQAAARRSRVRVKRSSCAASCSWAASRSRIDALWPTPCIPSSRAASACCCISQCGSRSARCSPPSSHSAAIRRSRGPLSTRFRSPCCSGLQSLSCWYLVQVLPAEETPLARLTGTWIGAGFVLLAIWVAAALGWAWCLRIMCPLALDDDVVNGLTPLLLFSGAAGLLVAVLGHYMLVAFERSAQAERRALELRVLARESELKSLRGQLDPHFLFNSLNSVAALIGSDAQAARRMCFLMAGFFRKSLALGGKQSIALSEEISLAETFLAIEEVRFGERLRTRFDVAEDALALAVPPLVLQPLVENAVHHGVAHLLEGGEVMVRARRRDGLLELAVENPCDPERPPSRGAGVGLAERALAHRGTVRAPRERRRESGRDELSSVDLAAGVAGGQWVRPRGTERDGDDRSHMRVLIVDDESLARAYLAEQLAGIDGVRDRGTGGEWLRGRQARGGAVARSHAARRADAEALRLRSAGIARRTRARGGVRHGARRVRAACLRGARGGLLDETRGARASHRRAGTRGRALARRTLPRRPHMSLPLPLVRRDGRSNGF